MMGATLLRPIAAIVAGGLFAAIAVLPARAAEPVFPPASRIGLAPPTGFAISKDFSGFEDRARKAAILIVELPAEAYEQIEKGTAEQILKAGGATVESNGPFSLAGGPAFLVVATQAADGTTVRKWVLVASTPELTAAITVQVPESEKDTYPDATIRATLATLTVRVKVPAEEQLGALPFKLNDLAGFRPVRVLTGGAVLLTEGPKDAIELAEQPLMLITIAPGGPTEPEDRERFARTLFGGTPAIKDMRLRRVESQRIGGQPGHEIIADGKDMKTDTDVTVVQWLRFTGGSYTRMLGVARKDAWDTIFPRFRALRDGVEPR
jgi:hypothetical protein